MLVRGISDTEEVLHRAHRLIGAVDRPYHISGRQLRIGASVGIAIRRPGEWTTPSNLLREADTALYRAKAAGKGTAWVFDDRMRQAAMARLRTESELRDAVNAGAFELLYQPIREVRTGRIAGAEALVRWRRGPGELLPLAAILTVVEESGLIIPIGRRVLHQALRDARNWLQAHPGEMIVGINLSCQQLHDPELARVLAHELERTGVPPAAVQVEIAESAFTDPRAASSGQLEELRALGVRLTLDDFGTGTASLGSLRTLHVDTVKLDCSAFAAQADPAIVARFAGMVTELAHARGLQVVLEGVETDAQLDLARATGCDYVQGFAVGRPIVAAAFARTIACDGSRAAEAARVVLPSCNARMELVRLACVVRPAQTPESATPIGCPCTPVALQKSPTATTS